MAGRLLHHNWQGWPIYLAPNTNLDLCIYIYIIHLTTDLFEPDSIALSRRRCLHFLSFSECHGFHHNAAGPEIKEREREREREREIYIYR